MRSHARSLSKTEEEVETSEAKGEGFDTRITGVGGVCDHLGQIDEAVVIELTHQQRVQQALAVVERELGSAARAHALISPD